MSDEGSPSPFWLKQKVISRLEMKLNWKGLEQSVEGNAVASWLGINEGPLSQLAGGPPVGYFLGPLALKLQDKAIILPKVRPILLDGKSLEAHLY